MAFYLVEARLKTELREELQRRLRLGEFRNLRPFGETLTESLEDARWDDSRQIVVWEEEDYCSPPLAEERRAVLDRYFSDIKVRPVDEGEGWTAIDEFPPLWPKAD